LAPFLVAHPTKTLVLQTNVFNSYNNSPEVLSILKNLKENYTTPPYLVTGLCIFQPKIILPGELIISYAGIT